MTLAESINATLDQILSLDRRVIVFGEDVGVKGGVYGVTGGLARRHGAARVFDTVLDEQSILGLGLGAGLAGLLPIPEIQYLAYLHNAEDQLRGEARDAVVLLPRRVPQPDGGPGRRARLPEGLRRSLPQRQRRRRAARHPRPGGRLPGPGRRRGGPAADLRRRGRRRRHGVGVPGADRALPPARPVRRRRPGVAGRRRRRARPDRPGPASTCPSTGSGRTAAHLDPDHLRQRRPDEPAGRPPAGRAAASPPRCSTCAGWRRCRWPTCSPPCSGRAGRWWSTRPGGPAASARAWSPALVEAGFAGPIAPGGQPGQLHPAGSGRRATCC